MTTTRCLSSRELIKPESVTHVLRQKCHPCPGLHRGYGLNRWVTVWSQEMGSRSARTWSHCLRTWVTVLSEGAPRRKSNACAGRDAHALEGDLSRG